MGKRFCLKTNQEYQIRVKITPVFVSRLYQEDISFLDYDFHENIRKNLKNRKTKTTVKERTLIKFHAIFVLCIKNYTPSEMGFDNFAGCICTIILNRNFILYRQIDMFNDVF